MLKIKKLDPLAKLPVKKPGDAAYDLYASETVDIAPGSRELVGTGIACEFPSNYVGRIVDRSGVAVKDGLHVVAGVIDASYRGEWKIALYNTTRGRVTVGRNTRIAQVLFYRVADWPVIAVDELSSTARGGCGFGSSGVK
jgi:dUTP pyrophosphatase